MEIFKCTLSKVEILGVLHNLYIYTHYMNIKGEFPMVIGRGRRREHTNQHFVLLLREKCGGKTGMRRAYFRTGPLPVTSVWRHFRSKFYYYSSKKTRGKPGMRRTYFRRGHVTDVTSSNVTDVISGHDPSHDPPQMIMCPSPYTTIEGNE